MPSSHDVKPRGRKVSVVLGVILVGVVIAAVALGRGGLPFGDGDEGETTGGPGGKLTQLHGVIGSEKRAYFQHACGDRESAGHRAAVPRERRCGG